MSEAMPLSCTCGKKFNTVKEANEHWNETIAARCSREHGIRNANGKRVFFHVKPVWGVENQRPFVYPRKDG